MNSEKTTLLDKAIFASLSATTVFNGLLTIQIASTENSGFVGLWAASTALLTASTCYSYIRVREQSLIKANDDLVAKLQENGLLIHVQNQPEEEIVQTDDNQPQVQNTEPSQNQREHEPSSPQYRDPTIGCSYE